MINQSIKGQNQLDFKKATPIPKHISEKIDNFLVLCVNEQNHKPEEDNGLKIDKIDGSVSVFPTFTEMEGSKSFIIWERVYLENSHVFNSLRLAARNRLIRQIADNIVTFLLLKYKKYSPSFSNILNDKRMKNQSIQYIEDILKRDTFLMNNEVWENFCEWFQIHLTEWVLDEMLQSLGANKLESLNRKELNELFYHYISKNLSENDDFITRFTSIVNTYTKEWVNKIFAILNLENYSIRQAETLLCLKDSTSLNTISLVSPSSDLTFNLAVNDCVFVMNNAPYQSVREALYKKKFKSGKEYLWPTAPLSRGGIEGTLQIKPFKKDHYTFNQNHPIVKESWEDAAALSDLDADVFDALCTIFLAKAKHYEDIIEIQLDDLLSIRGLKLKLGGDGRRGGYEDKQRRQFLKSLSIIQKLWIDLDKTIVYEKGKPTETKLQGRAFLFVDENRKGFTISEDANERIIRYKVDQVFARYLFGSGRQVSLLPLKILHYDPYRKTWEKRLGRYLSWRWRIQARKGDFLQPNKVITLLDALGAEMNERTPSRTRDRLEKALDTLQADGLIEAWHYEKWDEKIANLKGWARIWENSMIIIAPPEHIKEQYHTIKRGQQVQSMKQTQKQKMVMEELDEMAGERIRSVREQFNLSLSQVAEELEISASYLSNIERGIKTPSVKIQSRLLKWLERIQ